MTHGVEVEDGLARPFVDGLNRLHTERDVEPLAGLFADDATLSKLDDHHEEHGPDGARTFWQQYRSVFDDVGVTFTHIVQGEDSVALEWTSTGSLSNGRPFTYRGISVLEGREGLIRGFRTYYDSAAFLPQPADRA